MSSDALRAEGQEPAHAEGIVDAPGEHGAAIPIRVVCCLSFGLSACACLAFRLLTPYMPNADAAAVADAEPASVVEVAPSLPSRASAVSVARASSIIIVSFLLLLLARLFLRSRHVRSAHRRPA
jgi:hypothetical protein